jgi:hypothetical protein
MRITMSFLALGVMVFGGTPAAAAPAPFRPDRLIVRTCEKSWPAPKDVVAQAEAAMFAHLRRDPDGLPCRGHALDRGRRHPTARRRRDRYLTRRWPRLRSATTACDGILRVSATEPIDVNLWQLFEEWDVRLTQHCLGETCDAEGVRIVIDGRLMNMCPGAIPIEDGSSIELSID